MTEQAARVHDAADALLLAEDERARARALDPQRSVLLQAPAGSGKTTVLTQRILRLLALVDEPEEILAITFTRKAAAEMRVRVLGALREARAGQPEDSAHVQQMHALALAAREHARVRGWALDENPTRLRIQTIDSLNQWLASRLPIAARAGGELSVQQRPRRLYRLAARRTLEEAQEEARLREDVDLLFERLDNDWERFEQLLEQMLARRGHWLALLGKREVGQPLAQIVAQSLHAVVGEALAEACVRFPAELVREGLAHAARRIAAQAAGAPLAQCWREPPATLGSAPEQLPYWQGIAALALTVNGELRQSLTKHDGFGTEDRPAKARALGWLEAVRRVSGARDELLGLRQLPPTTLAPQDARALESLAHVLTIAAAQLEVVFAEQQRVDYAYVGFAARQALVEDGLPTDLGLRLGMALRHILVDEFQDTSLEQFELLLALTAGWEDGDGRTLFLVGDPMQSIYQFREAEVGLFLRAREHGVGELKLEPLRLTRNFRALPGLVSWANGAFAQLFPATDDLRASAVRFSASVAARAGAGGRVRLHRMPPGDARREARYIAELIAQLRAADAQARIAILVLARQHAAPITRALLERNIAVSGVDLVPLAEVPVVRDLAALTRALLHRADRIAWFAVLRAPWCGLTLGELTHLIERGEELSVWEALQRESRVALLPQDSAERVARVRAVLARAFAAEARMPLVDWIESTWLALGGPAACAADSDLANAQEFFRALGEAAAGASPGAPLDLDESLAALYATPSPAIGPVVEIMTMHGAKGLEFDHVLVPSLGRRARGEQEPLLRWIDLPRATRGSSLLLAPYPAAARTGPQPLTEFIKLLQRRRRECEQVRLLYVAATRARRELHWLGALPDADKTTPHRGTLLGVLWRVIGAEFLREPAEAAAAAHVADPAAALRAAWPLQRLSAAWRAPQVEPGPDFVGLNVASYEPSTQPQYDWVGQTSRHVGTLVHQILERLARAPPLPASGFAAHAREHYRARLAALGVAAEELDVAAARVAQAVDALLADERGRWILSADQRDAVSELALSGVVDGRLTSVAIDRSFIDAAGVRWVIDFKTSSHAGAGLEEFLAAELERYRPQLRRYAALARRLGPQPVRAALYFPLLRAFRESELA